jgi:hypothetical protein
MIGRHFLVLCLLFFGLISLAYASDEEIRSMTMKCEYTNYKSFQCESVSISPTIEGLTQPASVKKFKAGSAKQEHLFFVLPGEFAECIYPSGNRVRVKVGEETGYPYGECGADPEVFMSLWVNKRKVASREWFAGYCREKHGNPVISFKVFNGARVKKCHLAMQQENTADITPKQAASKQLSVCVDFPDVSKFPIDLIEYPQQGTKISKAGDIELLKGSDAVCQAVLNELKGDFYTFGKYPDKNNITLSRPNWSNASVELPNELEGSSESIFDFDNDGKLDRVFSRTFESRYMDGSVLLVQQGNSTSTLNVSDAPMDQTSSFLPCHIGETKCNIYDCPPFSQKNDGAKFSMEGRTNKDLVYFYARYSNLSPFSFRGTNYIGVSTVSEDAKGFVAVLKPLPNRKFQKKCLLRRVPENF